MRFELLTIEHQYKAPVESYGKVLKEAGYSKVFSIAGFLPSRAKQDQRQKPPRYLVYISKDPVGWKFQWFYRIFHAEYYLAVTKLQFDIQYPGGYPQKTGGITKLGPKDGRIDITMADGSKAYIDSKDVKL